MANFYSIKLLQLHVFGQKSKLALGPWGYTLSLGRYEALHLHFNGQDNEKKERSIIDRPASGPSKIRFGRPRLEAQRVLAAQMGQTPDSELYVQYIRKVSPRKNLTCQVVQQA
ncbi:hypothetical protein RAB80_006132 [Fusarium oxysporum f. sp. vasinfectum]|nr:hypothetical protein RAB80_006132 [Fusarium oxysporum f. sp. vasinfectum]